MWNSSRHAENIFSFETHDCAWVHQVAAKVDRPNAAVAGSRSCCILDAFWESNASTCVVTVGKGFETKDKWSVRARLQRADAEGHATDHPSGRATPRRNSARQSGPVYDEWHEHTKCRKHVCFTRAQSRFGEW